MKYNAFIFKVLSSRLEKYLSEYYDKSELKEWVTKAKPIYKELLFDMRDVSDQDPMGNNITTSFVVIALWLASDRKITPENMSKAFEKTVDMKILHWIFGHIDMNTEKGIRTFGNMMHKNAKWAQEHPEYPNTWRFRFNESLHKDGFYYNFTYCPIAAFCKKHGYEEINPVLCNIDFITMSMMHSVLHRDHTIAAGGEICDYWTVGDEVENPQ